MNRLVSFEREQWRRSHGQDVIEYALILPLLLLLLFGIADFGVVLMRYNTVANAAREGARAGVLPLTSECDKECLEGKALTAAQVLTTGLDPAELSIVPHRLDNGTMKVDVSYNARLMTGIIISALGGQDTIVLSSTATMQVE